MTGGSVVFDQAAGFYDQSRGLPADTAAAQTALLAAQVTRLGGPVLEVGVGTGRVAVPLAAALTRAGARVVGLDLSGPMLAELAAKGSGVPAVRADATVLPVRTGSAAAVIACHVLHLIPAWQQAVGEIIRVLAPGGVLLAARGRGSSPFDLQRRVRAAADVGDTAVGLDQLDELDRFLGQRGALVEHLPPIANSSVLNAAEYLSRIAANVYSWTWAIPPGRLQQAVAEVRAWLTDTAGDPAQVMLPGTPIAWRSYRLS
jgi:SAM-dependent methyltransferase